MAAWEEADMVVVMDTSSKVMAISNNPNNGVEFLNSNNGDPVFY